MISDRKQRIHPFVRRFWTIVVSTVFVSSIGLGQEPADKPAPPAVADSKPSPPTDGVIVLEGQVTDQIGGGGGNVTVSLHRKAV